jgi:predicted DNA-binding protein YlxM (UPF0122 family)
MKTISEIAKEIGVSRQAIYKQIKKEPLLTSLQKCISIKNNVTYIDENGEKLIRTVLSDTSFNTNETSDIVNSLQKQIEILSTQNNMLTGQLTSLHNEINKERDYGRVQSDRIAELANQLAKLSENNQILLDQQQRLQAASTQQLPGKKSKWFGWFKKKD